MYPAFIITKMLIDLLNMNRNTTGTPTSKGLSRYIENYRLYTDIYNLAGSSLPDAVRPDFVDSYADNITTKSIDPQTVDFNYFSLGGNRRDVILSDIGDSFLYHSQYFSQQGVSFRKWYDLVGNNRQFLDLINLKRWRIGLMGFTGTNARFSGTRHTITKNSNGDVNETTFNQVNIPMLGNLESSFDVDISNSSVETYTEVYYSNCTLIIPTNPQFEPSWAEVQKIISKSNVFDSELNTNVEQWDASSIEYNDNSTPFELRSEKPTGISDGEGKTNSFDFQRGLTILPEYTLDEVYALLDVPY